MHLLRIASRMNVQHNIQLAFTDEVVSWITEQCPVVETGARALIHFIEKKIVPELSRRILNNVEKLSRISLNIGEGQCEKRFIVFEQEGEETTY